MQSPSDGSVNTALSIQLSPLVGRLESLSTAEIIEGVLLAMEEAEVSEYKKEETEQLLNRLSSDRNQLYEYVVNLTLASKGLKAIPTRIRNK